MNKPTTEAQAIDRDHGCEFCKRFDFSSAKIDLDSRFAHICLAVGSTRYPEYEQFNFCPNCGRGLRKA